MRNIIITLIIILYYINITNIYSQDFIQNCPLSQIIPGKSSPAGLIGGLYKPERTDVANAPRDASFKVLLVFVQFANETVPSKEWPIGERPQYMNELLAENVNTTGNYWERYNKETQQLSAWYQEVSKGHMQVTGKAYNVFLQYEANHYVNTRDGLEIMNQEIYDNLYAQGVRWEEYDNWSGGSGNFSYKPDGYVDMIIKVHRTLSVNGLFYMNSAGYSCLGPDPFGGIEIHVPGNKIIFDGWLNVGSGITIVGTAGGPASKSWVFNIARHEIGHYWFGGGHPSSGVGIMGGGDIYLGAWESLKLGYQTSTVVDFNPASKYQLYDISARYSNGEILKVPINGEDEFFLITNRRQVSYFDRTMLGDTTDGIWNRVLDPSVDYGKGVYIYHHKSYQGTEYTETNDLECADGLWNWVQTGYDAPDWNPKDKILPVLVRTTPVRNANDDGMWTDINFYKKANKDGRDVAGRRADNINEGKWFSLGKKLSQSSDGVDRYFTNIEENWTSREKDGDRWDAWKKDYNEIFSPYSSPSTYNWDNKNSGIFIWITYQDSNRVDFKIYRVGIRGYDLNKILEDTPPSRPMGIKMEDYIRAGNTVCNPKITWTQNTEPDMISNIDSKLHYKIFRSITSGRNPVPADYIEIESDAKFFPNENPYYIDTTINKLNCFKSDNFNYLDPKPVRYYVKAVDKTNLVSVPSDFVSTVGTINSPVGILNNNEPLIKEFKLEQNFPNPFNPSTNIKYDLPKDIFVAIKIYDVLGREIKTLVNEFKNKGSYIVSLNGSEFASGIYFYKITAGDYIQIKRMMLIK